MFQVIDLVEDQRPNRAFRSSTFVLLNAGTTVEVFNVYLGGVLGIVEQ